MDRWFRIGQGGADDGVHLAESWQNEYTVRVFVLGGAERTMSFLDGP